MNLYQHLNLLENFWLISFNQQTHFELIRWLFQNYFKWNSKHFLSHFWTKTWVKLAHALNDEYFDRYEFIQSLYLCYQPAMD